MLRSLLAACSILVLLTSTILLPTSAQACPIKFPETLLSLYRRSDAIYVARYDKTVDHEVVEDTDERTVVATRQHFDISSTLKGENRKLFVLEERDYRYKNDVPKLKPEEPEDEEGDALYRRPELKSGDTVLLFLSIDKDSNRLELADYRDAIKKMSPERLAAYEARINDLNSIFSAKTVDDAAIVDWLIRCIQDPLTRWEGAFELQQAYERMLYQERMKQEEKDEADKEDADKRDAEAGADATADAESVQEETTSAEEEAMEQAADTSGENSQADITFVVQPASWYDTTVYARMLTDNQKQLLTDTLLDSARESAGKNKPNFSTAGDQALLELVSNWGDARLARFLIDKIQTAGVDYYVISEWMTTAARVLKDPQLEKLAEDYSDAFYQDDDAVVGADEDEDENQIGEAVAEDEIATDAPADVATEPESAEEEETADAVDESVEKSPVEADGDAPKKMTYKEFREQLLAKFIERSAFAIAHAEAKQIAKAGN